MFAAEADVPQDFKGLRLAHRIAHQIPHEVFGIGQRELPRCIGFAGRKPVLAVHGDQLRGQRSRAATDIQREARLRRLDGEQVERHIGLHLDVRLDQRQFGLHEARNRGAGDADRIAVDVLQRRGQHIAERPELSGVKNQSLLARHNVCRKARRVHKRQLCVNHQHDLPAGGIKMHPDHGIHLHGIDRQRMVIRSLIDRAARMESHQIDKIGDLNIQAAGQGALGDVLQDKKQIVVAPADGHGRCEIHLVGGNQSGGGFVEYIQRESLRPGRLPLGVKDQQRPAGTRAGRSRGYAPEILRLVRGRKPLRAAAFLFILPFALRVRLPFDHDQRQSDHMSADNAPFRVVAAGALAGDGSVLQQLELTGHVAVAVGQSAAHKRVLVGNMLHPAGFAKRFPFAENARARPVNQHLLCYRKPHKTVRVRGPFSPESDTPKI